MDPPRLDWSSATVSDGKLSVKIEGDPPDGWQDSFTTTVALLGGRDLGTVELRKRTARVKGITPGDEERVRHMLESAVQQANADHEQSDKEDEQHERNDEASDQDHASVDQEMTERFRSFASDGDGR